MNTGTVTAQYHAGGIAAYIHDSAIEKAYNSGRISSAQYSGGIVGYGLGCQIKACYNTGTITATADYAGGILAFDADKEGTLADCYNIGAVSGQTHTAPLSNVFGDDQPNYTNCYYLVESASGQPHEKTAEAFENGEAAYLLGASYGQKIGTDTHPVFRKDNEVFSYTACNGNAAYTNDSSLAGTALGHTAGEPVRENVVPATKDHKGSYDEVIYCAVCNTELSRVTKITPKLDDDDRPSFPTIPIIGLPSTTPTFPFRDVPASAWYYDAVKSAWKVHLIDGVTSTEFRPDENMTVAQAIKLAAAVHQLNRFGKVSLQNGRPSWYSTYVDYAIDNGLIESAYADYTAAQMNVAVTRAEFVHIFHAATDDLREMNTVADNAIPDVKTGDAFAVEIYDFYRAGVLTGSDANGTFHPTDSIKRSEVAAILIRMYDSSTRVLCTF